MRPAETPIVLADEPPFRLGPVAVDPATRQVTRGGAAETLEPRVMQVLVALARAPGAVVGRDALAALCWEGRIVGDNALQRVVSRLRRLAATLGEGAFTLETITKVGYRLVVHAGPEPAGAPPGPSPAAPAPRLDRRVLVGGAAAALVVAGLGAWRALGPGGRDAALARALVEQGRDALRQGLPEADAQAVAFFRRAAQTDPDSAAAWGALALGHARAVDFNVEAEQPAQAALARGAAARALALEPGQADAEAALALIPPTLRRWAAAQGAFEGALARHPGHPWLIEALASLLLDTGRVRAAAPLARALLAAEPLSPAAHALGVAVDWTAGDLAAAGRALARAAELWPNHRYFWSKRFILFALGGQPEAAIALAADEQARPAQGPRERPIALDVGLRCARALASGAPGERAAAVAAIRAARAAGSMATHNAVFFLCALGRADEAFDQARAYFLGRPPPGYPRAPGPLARRQAAFLFTPNAAPLRAHPGFPALTAAIGLDEYWRVTGSAPDYRS